MRVLEIGAGGNPILEPGWEHLDARDLWHIEYVQDGTDLSNFTDDEFDRIVARDVIEHISWRKIRATLCEWFRVAPILEIETPDAHELRRILENPDHPDHRRVREESDWEMFNRICFGHQDYPENSHASYFTPLWLEELLLDSGADAVITKYEDGYRFVLEAHRE